MDEVIPHYCTNEACDKYMQVQARMWNHRGGVEDLSEGAWWNHQPVWTSNGRCTSCNKRMIPEDHLPTEERDAIRDAEQRKYEARRDRLMKRFGTTEPVWTTTQMIDGQHMVIKYSGTRDGEPWVEHVMEAYES